MYVEQILLQLFQRLSYWVVSPFANICTDLLTQRRSRAAIGGKISATFEPLSCILTSVGRGGPGLSMPLQK